MFSKLRKTDFPPKAKPIVVYDGKCGFCKYWVIKWMKITGLSMEYKPYQEVAANFQDIKKEDFKEAVRLIMPNGEIYNGPDVPYMTYYSKGQVTFLHRWYEEKKWFRNLSDWAYQWVADNRNFLSKVSIRLFGKNPANPKPYWKYYLLGFVLFLSLVIVGLANI